MASVTIAMGRIFTCFTQYLIVQTQLKTYPYSIKCVYLQNRNPTF